MTLIAILFVTFINVMTSFYLIKRYSSKETVLQLCFVLVWTVHYVVGNILVLVSRDFTFIYSRFEYFETSYLIALVIGQYFIWTYLFLLNRSKDAGSSYVPLRERSRPALFILLFASMFFGFLLIYLIGPSSYFSQELAQYRARLGDYAFAGVGVYYYLAGLLLPATILMGAYTTVYRRLGNILIFIIAMAVSLLVFVPLGGRGRVVNILLVLLLNYVILRGEFRISKLITVRTASFLVAIIAVSFLWGRWREGPTGVERSSGFGEVAYSLSIDTTRLPPQAFILDRYPAGGTYYGTHYLESLLGPFYSLTNLPPAGLIPELSSQWYSETVWVPDLKSAISPSYIGEIYLNFGAFGILIAPFVFFLIVRGAMRLGNERSALSVAVVVYFVQFSLFHGGLYALFDMLLLTMPMLLFTRLFSEQLPAEQALPQGARGRLVAGT